VEKNPKEIIYDMTAIELLDNTSHMNWLTPSQKILVEAMMITYKELSSKSDAEIEEEANKRYNPKWGGLNGMTENKKFIEGAKWMKEN
jgi:hypothetical protein